MRRADHLTYMIDHGRHQVEDRLDCLKDRKYTRVAQGVFRIYATDENGEPASPMDEALLKYNQKSERALRTGKIKKVKQYVHNFLNELLNLIPKPEEVTDSYMEDHVEELQYIGQLMATYENIRTDCKYIAEYMDSLPETVQTRIRSLYDIHLAYSVALQMAQVKHLVDLRCVAKEGVNTEEDLELFREDWENDTSAQRFLETLKKNEDLLREYREHPISIEEEIRKARRDKKEANKN